MNVASGTLSLLRTLANWLIFVWGAMFYVDVPAAEDAVRIEAVKILRTTPEYIEVEISAAYDGSMGELTLGPLAKSIDGTVRSSGYWPIFFPAGEKLKLVAKIASPNGLEQQQTHFITAKFYKSRSPVMFYKHIKLDYTWPAIAIEDYDYAKGRRVESETKKYITAISDTLSEEDFMALDGLLEKWGNMNERDSDGNQKLGAFKDAVLYSLRNQDWKITLQRLQKWKKHNDKSVGAVIGESIYWLAYASVLLENGKLDNADLFLRNLYSERIKMAEKILLESSKLATKSPIWHEAYLDLAIKTRRDARSIEKLFSEGTKQYPDYLPLYALMADYYVRQSGGEVNWNMFDEVISKALSLSSVDERQSNFARLFILLSNMQGTEVDLLRQRAVSWLKLKSSLEELVKKYPSHTNFNIFANLACRAGDRNVYLGVRPRINRVILPNVWSTNYSVDLCDHRFLQQS